MKIGILKDNKKINRVALVPNDVQKLVTKKIEVLIQSNAGKKCGFSDVDYEVVGAKIFKPTKKIIEQSDVVFKCNLPTSYEINLCAKFHKPICSEMYLSFHTKTLFKMMKKKVTSLAFDSYHVDGQYPMLEPIEICRSNFVANMVPILLSTLSEKGIGRSITPLTSKKEDLVHVTLLNDSLATRQIAKMLLCQEVYLTILESRDSKIIELNQNKELELVRKNFNSVLDIKLATQSNIENCFNKSHVFIYSPISPDANAQQVLTEKMIDSMPLGSVYVDLFPIEGFTVAGLHPEKLTSWYFKLGKKKIKYSGIPSLYCRSVSSATSPQLLKIIETIHAAGGFISAIKSDKNLQKAIATHDGHLTSSMIAGNLKIKYQDINKLIK